jgi:hypothetical protein
MSVSESADDYPHLVAILNAGWRVIECAAGIQWILQRRKGERHGSPRWDAKKPWSAVCESMPARLSPLPRRHSQPYLPDSKRNRREGPLEPRQRRFQLFRVSR